MKLFSIVALTLAAGWLACPLAALATSYYISPSGSDSNLGSLASPWKTISFALSHLAAGDTLDLRGGIYYESNLTTSVSGTATNPITIQSYPGEQATIDGGMPDFKTLNNGQWTLVDSSIGLYKSAQTLTGTYLGASLVNDNMQLRSYPYYENLTATLYNQISNPTYYYFGQGVQLGGPTGTDGHIYIRLTPNPVDSFDVNGNPLSPIPTDTDPNHNAIDIYTSHYIFRDGLSYVTLNNLTLTGAKTLIDWQSGSTHLTVTNCTFLYGRFGIDGNLNSGNSNLEVANSTFDNQLPYFVYWTDVKNPADGGPAPQTGFGGGVENQFQSTAINGGPQTDFNVHDNIFKNGFDGLFIPGQGATNISVKNNQFMNFHDDSINFFMSVGGAEVAHNIMWHVNSGISIVAETTSLPPGDVFIHHNVIDDSAYRHGGRTGNYRFNDWPVWTTDSPFSGHGGNVAGTKLGHWKVYNNTLVTRRNGYNQGANPTVQDSPEKYVLNNIFYALDDRILYERDLVSGGTTYDGNIIWQATPGTNPLFQSFGDGGNYTSLALFRAAVPAWEVHGLQIDPGFNTNLITNPSYDYNTIFNRYIPTNSQVFTTGATYSGLNWPETAGITYRGAIPPSGVIPSPSPTPIPGDLNGDGHVNLSDLQQLLATLFPSIFKYNDVISNFGK